MRPQTIILAALVSLYLWIGIFDTTRTGYRVAQALGVVPNLHIGESLSRLL